MNRNPYLSYYTDKIKSLRSEINLLRRTERAFVKEMRKACSHSGHLKRLPVMSKLPMFAAQGSDPFTATVKYKVVCQDCGKVIQK
jgi:hypothetical protein